MFAKPFRTRDCRAAREQPASDPRDFHLNSASRGTTLPPRASVHCKMNSFRFARSALRARPSVFSMPVQRRGYAEAVSDKIKLSLTLPHQVRLQTNWTTHQATPIVLITDKYVFLDYLQLDWRVCQSCVLPRPERSMFFRCPHISDLKTHTDGSFRRNSVQVNLPAESGEMGVLANHVPSIEQLKPGLVEVLEEGGASKKFFRMSDAQVFRPWFAIR